MKTKFATLVATVGLAIMANGATIVSFNGTYTSVVPGVTGVFTTTGIASLPAGDYVKVWFDLVGSFSGASATVTAGAFTAPLLNEGGGVLSSTNSTTINGLIAALNPSGQTTFGINGGTATSGFATLNLEQIPEPSAALLGAVAAVIAFVFGRKRELAAA